MEKYVPYEKLSKKQRRALDAKRRGGWGALSPVTRRPQNPRAYNRKKARKWSDDLHDRAFLLPFHPSIYAGFLCYSAGAARAFLLAMERPKARQSRVVAIRLRGSKRSAATFCKVT